jgi:hypothetical protein
MAKLDPVGFDVWLECRSRTWWGWSDYHVVRHSREHSEGDAKQQVEDLKRLPCVASGYKVRESWFEPVFALGWK